ncbi:MAG: hypothetical protein KIT31_11145 [Deltaproteobacteria bacterium]|nr:hypothetical protein [Deltaproteobacteria bacterium]
MFHHISRRCSQRMFLMRPDEETSAAFLYCLIVAATKWGIRVLVACAMSNHYHAVIYDEHGNYPRFLQQFHRLFARVMNRVRDREENFWSSEQTSVVALLSPKALLEALVYAATNPVKDHLVARVRDWPGVNTLEALLEGKALEGVRPRSYFRANGKMPRNVAMTPTLPEHPWIGDATEFLATLARMVGEAEADARADLAAGRAAPLGAAAVLARSPPASPMNAEREHDLNPQFATGDVSLVRRAIEFYESFQQSHRDTRRKWCAGDRRALFPAGTYWMRVHMHVRVASTHALAPRADERERKGVRARIARAPTIAARSASARR